LKKELFQFLDVNSIYKFAIIHLVIPSFTNLYAHKLTQ